MNYIDNDGEVVSKDEILNLINDKLSIIQSQLFYNVNNKQSFKYLKVVNATRIILIILTLLFGVLSIINFSISSIIYTVFSGIGVIGISVFINKKN